MWDYDRFIKLLEESDTEINYIGEGSYGVVFVIRNKGKKYILKLTFIANEKMDIRHISDDADDSRILVSKKLFDSENNIQKDIFNRSNEHGYPLCPEIFYYSIFNSIQKITELNKNIIKKVDFIKDFESGLVKELFEHFEEKKMKYNISLGVTLMDYLDGYYTLSSLRQITYIAVHKLPRHPSSPSKDPYDREIKPLRLIYEKIDEDIKKKIKFFRNIVIHAMAIVILLTMIGYEHIDGNSKNIMYNDEGRIMLIDFGLSKRLDPNQHKKYLSMIKNKEYVEVLSSIIENGFVADMEEDGIESFKTADKGMLKFITGHYDSLLMNNDNIKDENGNTISDKELNDRIDEYLSSISLFKELSGYTISKESNRKQSEQNRPYSSKELNSLVRAIIPDPEVINPTKPIKLQIIKKANKKEKNVNPTKTTKPTKLQITKKAEPKGPSVRPQNTEKAKTTGPSVRPRNTLKVKPSLKQANNKKIKEKKKLKWK